MQQTHLQILFTIVLVKVWSCLRTIIRIRKLRKYSTGYRTDSNMFVLSYGITDRRLWRRSVTGVQTVADVCTVGTGVRRCP